MTFEPRRVSIADAWTERAARASAYVSGEEPGRWTEVKGLLEITDSSPDECFIRIDWGRGEKIALFETIPTNLVRALPLLFADLVDRAHRGEVFPRDLDAVLVTTRGINASVCQDVEGLTELCIESDGIIRDDAGRGTPDGQKCPPVTLALRASSAASDVRALAYALLRAANVWDDEEQRPHIEQLTAAVLKRSGQPVRTAEPAAARGVREAISHANSSITRQARASSAACIGPGTSRMAVESRTRSTRAASCSSASSSGR
jgi:hypothetical protein